MTTELTLENLSLRLEARFDRQAERMSKIEMRIGVEMGAAYDRLDAQAIVVATRGEQIEKLQSVNASQSTRIDDLERAILEEAANVAGLGAHIENQAVNQRKRSDALHDQVCTINERLGIHVTRLDAQSSSIDSLIERDEQLERKIEKRSDRQATRFEAIDERIERQAGTLCKLDERIGTVDEKLADETFRIDGQVDDLEIKHGERLSTIESELEDTTRTANSAEMEASDAKADLYSLDQSVDGLKSELSSLSHTVTHG